MRNHVIYLFCFFLALSCRKNDEDSVNLGSIDLSNGDAICLAVSAQSRTSADSMKLFRFSNIDALSEINFFGPNGVKLGDYFIPERIYNLDDDRFLLVVSRKGKTPKELRTYIIQKSDGTAKELKSFPLPQDLSNSAMDYSLDVKSVVSPKSDLFFFVNNSTITSLTIDDNNATFRTISAYKTNFETDTCGNIMAGNALIDTSGTETIISNMGDNEIVLRSFTHNFFTVKAYADSFLIWHIDGSDSNYKYVFHTKVEGDFTDWNYLGKAYFKNSLTSVVIFDKGLLLVREDESKSIPLSTFLMSSVTNFDQSSEYLYLTGLNPVNYEVFDRIDLYPEPPTYTQIFAPNRYHYKLFNIHPRNTLTFYAKRLSDNMEVYGYATTGSAPVIFDNDQSITAYQLLTLK